MQAQPTNTQSVVINSRIDKNVREDYEAVTSPFEPLDSPQDINISGTSSNSNICEDICNNCSFWRTHSSGYPTQHKSCICELFASQAICCLEGFSNLMRLIPFLILYAPTPNKYIYHTINPYTYPIQINKNQVIEIVNLASNLKQNIIPSLKLPYKNQSFMINNAGS